MDLKGLYYCLVSVAPRNAWRGVEILSMTTRELGYMTMWRSPGSRVPRLMVHVVKKGATATMCGIKDAPFYDSRQRVS